MPYERILLVSPPSESHYGGLRVPAGIGYIAQALYDNNIEYDYIDMRIGNSFKKLKQSILSFKPDLIGISMITLGYKYSYQMISEIKKLFPHIKIVIGGHHMTILKEKVFEECDDIDFGIVFDGEETIVELCKNSLPINDIKGLIFRTENQIIFTGHRPLINNLDKYNFPRYHNFRMKDYSKQIPIHSSRGCVFQCTFCPNKLLGRQFRTKSTDHFVDEIEYWYERGYKQFAIDDDNFTLYKERVYDICDEIEKRGLNNLFIRCSNGIRADRVDRQLLARMKEIGVREIGFGVDGGNNKVLNSLKKGESIEKIDEAVKYACELGFDVRLYIIVGTPHETKSDIEDSLRFAQKYPVARVNFNNAIPYPGTEMFEYVRKHHLFTIPPEKYLNHISEDRGEPVFETLELPRAERIKILKRCHKVGNWIMKNTATRMYKNIPFSGFFIKYFFNVQLFEFFFFKTLFFRNIFEKIRYKKLMNK